MLDRADIALLLIVGLVLFVSRLVTTCKLRRDWAKVQKYRLYKVRDELIMLVAKGLVREDEFIFENFYRATSFYIKKTNTITLSTFIAAVMDAEKTGLDLATRERVKRVHEALKSKDPRVGRAISEFYQTILEILLENSPTLRFYLFIGPVLAPLQKCRKLLDDAKSIVPQRAVLDIYRRYAEAAHAF
jgi:hypothetical protein